MHEKNKFYKYQGAGNDFILIDNRQHVFEPQNSALVKKMCDRRFGIGADGLMLLQKTDEADFEMIYFNANGLQASMCGNGGRCIVAFARDLKIIEHKTDFLAVDGLHFAQIKGDDVALSMIDVLEYRRDSDAYILHTGSPHYVKITTDVENLDVYNAGRKIRYSQTYSPQGINVNFVEREQSGYFVRTYERGVENETLACGTGATAAAISIAINENRTGTIEIPIRVLGGQLQVNFERDENSFTKVILQGPAEYVFEGTY